MSTIFQDSFDVYAVSADLNMKYLSNAVLSITSGRYGGGGATFSSINGTELVASLPTQPTSVWLGFAVMMNSSSVVEGAIMQFISVNGVECCIQFDPVTFSLKLYKLGGNLSGSNMLGATANVPITPNTWHWIDVFLTLDAATGASQIWVDNVKYLDITGVQTVNQSGSNGNKIVSICWGSGMANNSVSVCAMTIDDIIVRDTLNSVNTTRIGDSRIMVNEVASDATPNNGTPSTGTDHFACVNEAQWSSSKNLLLSNTSGQAEQFTINPLPNTPTTIYDVQVVAVCQKTDGGTAFAEVYVDSSSNEADGPSTAVKSTFGMNWAIFDKDPHGNIAWTYAAVNALQIGYKVP